MIKLYEDTLRYRVIDPADPYSDIMPKYINKLRIPPTYIQDLVDAGTHEVHPIANYVKTWKENRLSNIAGGGYGTINEQLEMLYDKSEELGITPGIQYWLDHQTTVKTNFPKP